jgi:hypothetical protein
MTVLNLAQTAAMNFMASRGGRPAAWAVDVDDEGRWVQIAGCPTKAIARETLAHLVTQGVDADILRVRRMPVG